MDYEDGLSEPSPSILTFPSFNYLARHHWYQRNWSRVKKTLGLVLYVRIGCIKERKCLCCCCALFAEWSRLSMICLHRLYLNESLSYGCIVPRFHWWIENNSASKSPLTLDAWEHQMVTHNQCPCPLFFSHPSLLPPFSCLALSLFSLISLSAVSFLPSAALIPRKSSCYQSSNLLILQLPLSYIDNPAKNNTIATKPPRKEEIVQEYSLASNAQLEE